jgi:hypothetical protein
MKSPLLAKIKFEPTFFQVLWRFAFPLPLFSEAGGRGVRPLPLPPAEPVNKIGSDFFKYPPPIRKRGCWLALCEGSPANFRRKIEFFVFVPLCGTPEAGFSKLEL